MNVLKQLDTAHEFCQMLLRGETGTRDMLANKLGITPRWVTVYKNKIEKLYSVQILYCRTKQSYYIREEDYKNLPPRAD